MRRAGRFRAPTEHRCHLHRRPRLRRLGSYGATAFRTPCLDRLAAEGTRFTAFYSQVVCGPARSALLTGRQPVRSDGWSMPASEITVAELLQKQGYATACIGKWDVSNRAALPDRVPTAQGFDCYYGALGANDNVASDHPDVVARLTAFARAFVWPEKLPDPGIALPGAAGKSTAKKKSP